MLLQCTESHDVLALLVITVLFFMCTVSTVLCQLRCIIALGYIWIEKSKYYICYCDSQGHSQDFKIAHPTQSVKRPHMAKFVNLEIAVFHERKKLKMAIHSL